MASSSSPLSNAPVTVLWDYGNIWVPKEYPLSTLRGNIEQALRHKDNRFRVDEIIAVGPPTGFKRSQLPADFTIVDTPRDNFRCEDVCKKLVVYYPRNSDERIMRKTDVADVYMIQEIFMNVLKRKENILIITDDADFVSTVKALHGEGKPVMLAQTDKCSHELRRIEEAKAVWLWSNLISGGSYILRIRK